MTNDREVINRLLTLAGVIMEDTSPIALIDDPATSFQDRIRATDRAGRSIQALAHAAEIVLAQVGNGDV